MRQISLLIGANGSPGEIREVIQKTISATAKTWWRVASLEGLGEGLRLKQRTGDGLEGEQMHMLQTFFDQEDASVRKVYLNLFQQMGLPESPARQQAIEQATSLINDAEASPAARADAIRLITLAGPAPHQAALEQVIVPEEPAVVQEAAFEALNQIPGPEVGQFVLDHWNSLTPGLRDAAVNVFMKEEARALLLLDAIEAGVVLPATIGWQRRVALMRNWEGEVREKARALLSVKPEARIAVVEQYQTVLAQAGDADQGRIVFAQVCSTCHQISGAEGAVFGPDLATIRHWPRKALLAKILNPGRSLADGYELWTITRKNGEILSGVIAAETPSAITVHLPGGIEQILPRGDIVSLQSTGVSAMPAGLEQQIDPQQMTDLLAYLKESS